MGERVFVGRVGTRRGGGRGRGWITLVRCGRGRDGSVGRVDLRLVVLLEVIGEVSRISRLLCQIQRSSAILLAVDRGSGRGRRRCGVVRAGGRAAGGGQRQGGRR